MDEKKLWKYIKKNSKPSYQSILDDNNKPYNVVANKGLKEGEIAIRGGGEYNGFSIKALENIKPVLTNLRVSKAIKLHSQGNIQGTIVVLRIVNEVQEIGLGLLYAVLKIWLDKNEIPVPPEYSKKALPINEIKSKNPLLLQWITSMTYGPILGKFEIVGVGFSKGGHPVVPESWLGRIFNDANELHEEMDKLDWRKGKPPVNFCCIYAMNIKKIKLWDEVSANLNELNVKMGITIFPKFNKKGNLLNLNSDVTFFNKKEEYNQWLNNLPSNSKTMSAGLLTDIVGEKLLIACDLYNIIEKQPIYEKTKNVGLLVSALQKLIRRGRGCSKILETTLTQLWKSPNYNLPEQQFLRVSACRQLTWRLFITTIEDVQPFSDDNSNQEDYNYISMLDIACLSILANVYPDAQFTELLFNKILYTALLIQHNDDIGSKWDLFENNDPNLNKNINNSIKPNNPFLKSLKMLSLYMPMRYGDYVMIQQSFNYINNGNFTLKPLTKLSLEELLKFANSKEALAGELASHDMAPHPNILIQLQSSFPFLPYNKEKHTTKTLASFIWYNSSSVNVRLSNKNLIIYKEDESKQIFESLLKIQNHLVNPKFYKLNLESLEKKLKKDNKNKYILQNESNNKIREVDSRLGFLLLFGQKTSLSYNKKKYEVIITGTKEIPCKVKSISKNESIFLEGFERFEAEVEYIKWLNNNKIIIDTPKPPIGYKWIWGHKPKVNISAELINSDAKNLINKIVFYVDDYKLEPFNTSTILIHLPKIQPKAPPIELIKIIKQTLYFDSTYDYDDYQINLINRKLSESILPLYNWVEIAKKSLIPDIVWKCIIVKLFNNYNSTVQIGPVDGMGNKLHDSINYLYEGTLLRIFNMLSMIYPNTIIPKNPLNFVVNTHSSEYLDLINKLNSLAFLNTKKNINIKNYPNKIILKTKLWEHQQKTSDKILDELIILGKRGFGDASNVGAGKTLTALSIISGLYNYNVENNILNYYGFLVLLPTTYLYKTWEDEIIKHTSGFNIVTQNANGTLNGEIRFNTILVTTLGRMRDHPISQPWVFVVIDECLSVQNKNALQSEEAWRQIICSQYKCLLLSATFFRARFDKLFYMLKMLESGLPENKIYLDTILSEHIISNIPTKTRNWITNITRYKLPNHVRKQYDLILKQDLNSERLYIKLLSFLYDSFDYIDAFRQIINKTEKKNGRCLIYAKSKDEADEISEKIKSVTRFPDISGKHVVISYTEGTYGLNQLVIYDTIVTRPPEPDKLPQMKGRLDRYGQKSNTLYIEFFIIENTIEEASLFRMELANNFFNNYILPLADFYDIAIGKKPKIIPN